MTGQNSRRGRIVELSEPVSFSVFPGFSFAVWNCYFADRNFLEKKKKYLFPFYWGRLAWLRAQAEDDLVEHDTGEQTIFSIDPFIDPLIHSFINKLIDPFIDLFMHSFIFSIPPFMHLYIHWSIHWYIHANINWFIHWSIYHFVYKSIDPFIDPFIDPLINFLIIHWLIPDPCSTVQRNGRNLP